MSRTATSHQSPTVLAVARTLLGAHQPPRMRCTRTSAPPVDLDAELLDAAAGVLTQLRVLGALAQRGADTGTMVRDIYATAEHHDIAPVGAIGVTGVLADLLREPSERHLAGALRHAHDAFTDAELVNGAAAMFAATSWHLADQLGLDPLDVVDEVTRRPVRPPSTRRRCRRPR